jgi:hypothetical protein
MLEKAARAAFDDFMGRQFGTPVEWEGDPPADADELELEWRNREWKDQRLWYLVLARAVLAAIREPDEAMLSAAYGDAIVGHGAAFTAMIDAILEGETK